LAMMYFMSRSGGVGTWVGNDVFHVKDIIGLHIPQGSKHAHNSIALDHLST